MNKKWAIIFLSLITLSSCAGHTKKNAQEKLEKTDAQFYYTDKNGQFSVRITSGAGKKENTFFTKKTIELPNRQKDNVLEQSVALSDLGSLKKKIFVLRPKLSQYTVWFDGKKYTSDMKINPAQKSIEVKMTSPESQWSGTKQIKFPPVSTLPCFFSQIIDCAKVTGFINKASEKKTGTMNLLVIWEGYPYLNETFSDFPSELFSDAQLEYDGKTKEGERRFNLRVAGQSIFYVLNDKDAMVKMFWVSQGISMVNKSLKEDPTIDEGGDFE